MTANATLAITLHDLRLLKSSPIWLINVTVMPIVLMTFLAPAFALPGGDGDPSSGAAQAVPGMAVVFGLFVMGSFVFGVFQEHGWKTWDRTRASQARTRDIALGKMAGPAVVLTGHQCVLFLIGGWLCGLEVAGPLTGLAVVIVAWTIFLLTFGVLLVSICKTILQVNTVTNIGTMVIAGLGGALTPVSTLPGWAEFLAPVSPAYWAMKGYTSVIVDGSGPGDVVGPVAMLLAISLAFFAVASIMFSSDDAKSSQL